MALNNINQNINLNVNSATIEKAADRARELQRELNALRDSSNLLDSRAQKAIETTTSQLESAASRYASLATAAVRAQNQPLQFRSPIQMIRGAYGSVMQSMYAQYTQAAEVAAMGDASAAYEQDALASKIRLGTIIGNIASAADKLYNGARELVRSVTGISISIKDTFRDVRSNITGILEMYTGAATYSTGSSLIMNRAARSLQLQYGITGSEAYGLQAAGKALGINVTSMEDIAYMNPEQRMLFTQYLQKYTTWHDKMESSGLLLRVQEMQLEFSEFKRDLSMEFLSWVAANKDSIMGIMRGTLNVLEWIFDAIKWALPGKQAAPVMNVTMSGVTDQTEMRSALKEYLNEFASQVSLELG